MNCNFNDKRRPTRFYLYSYNNLLQYLQSYCTCVYLCRYFKNHMPFEVFTAMKDSPVIPALKEVVSLCFFCHSQVMHIPESWWKQRSSGQDQSHPPLRPCNCLVYSYCICCSKIIQQLIQTFKNRSMIHKIKTYNV